MTPLAGDIVLMTGETTSLIHLGKEAVTSIDEGADGIVTARSYVVTPLAVI